MARNEEMSKIPRNARRNVKIIQIAVLGVILIYVIILVVLPYIGITPIFAGDDPFIPVISGLLGIAAVIGIALGYFQPRRIVKRMKEEMRSPSYIAVVVVLLRGSFFLSVAAYGLILGFLGAGWKITLPFFIVAAAAMIITFPTEERLKRMIER